MEAKIDPRLRGSAEDEHTIGAVPRQQGVDLDKSTDAAQESPTTSTGGPTPASTVHSYGGPQTPHSHLVPVLPGTEDSGGNPHDPNDPKRLRACEACRGLKVKCEPDASNPDGPCKRCSKAGRNCIVTQPTRKRQKKTDSRVAELEKKIDALTASLQATRGADAPPGLGGFQSFGAGPLAKEWSATPSRDAPPPTQHGSGLEKPAEPAMLPPAAGQKRKFADAREEFHGDGKSWPLRAFQNSRPPLEEYVDVVDRGLLTLQQADEFLARYMDHMAPHLPAVVLPPGTTAAQLRQSKPILFLAVMASASAESPDVQRVLIKEIVQMFADKVMISGEKSMELVQALQVCVIWYHPPEYFEELKFYQYVHIAAVMAIDIGLGRRRNNAKQRLIPYTWKDHPLRKTPLPEPTTIEARRTWIACYFLTSNVAMALHRPNLIRWTTFLSECMDVLQTSPEAAPSDKYLCHLVWTHHLAEEVGIQFSMDDPSVWVNVAEPKVQYALRGFERDLEKYSDSIPASEKRSSLRLSFHVLSLYMHEIALYVDKADEKEKPPHHEDALREPVPGLNEGLTAAHIGALSSCLTAIDGIFETFLSMDVQTIRCLPVFNFVRVAYAVVVLIKLYFSASSPDSELGKVINKDHMRAEEYLDKLLEKFRQVGAEEKSRPANKFVMVLTMLRSWFRQQGQGTKSGAAATPQGGDNTPSRATERSMSASSHLQQQQASDYKTANTPLQLLSEIATGNRDNDQNSLAPGGGVSSSAASLSGWSPSYAVQQQQQQQQSPFIFDPASMAVTAGTAGGGGGGSTDVVTTLPYLTDAFNDDFTYPSLGDGFEQAMGLTFGGFAPPFDINGVDPTRYFLQGMPPSSGGFQFL
ncbi:hypothetical protein BX600DRAFT_508112 [Xylariales sp. PMI_506]|nr:hypothetical protein BX600DRAFT_508112 [Xylariales sp. PMI_506]